MKLYSYQERVLECIKSDPSHSQLISMPTGTGKTVTFLHAILQENKKCLVIVHRDELLKQTYEKALLCGFKEDEISLITAADKGDIRRLTICMVQTLARNLTKYKPEDVEMIVVDEAHHSTATSYWMIFEYFKIFQEKKLMLGFTATPLRGDKEALSSIFLSHSFKMTLSEATQLGYICPVHGLRIDMQRSLKDIDNMNGDYDMQKLEKVMNCEEVNNIIVERCQNLGKVPAIVFCTSVNHAKELSRKLREKKRKAISISYLTPKKSLEKIFKMLKEGRIDFITNAVKLSEGFDFPAIRTIVLARPTRSPVLYKQMIGRGLRLSKDKYDCFVMEFSGNDSSMICWEDIDDNCTFQSSTETEKKTRKEAINFYSSRFRNSDHIIVEDVRVSPFKFYECKILRMEKYKKFFYYCPFPDGFQICELRPEHIRNRISGGNYFFLYGSMCIWREKYKSFYFYHGPEDSCECLMGPTALSIKDATKWLMGCYKAQDFGIWYPSEEEPITGYQKKILGNEKVSARKAQMMIEDLYIKKAIDQFFITKNFSPLMEIK